MLTLTRSDTRERFDFPADTDVMTIGRGEANDLVIDNPHVSALHGQINRREGAYLYRDLHSTNGSAVERDGRRTVLDGVSASAMELRRSDRILLGHEREPVILEVTTCRPTGRQAPRGATVVATHRMASAGEASGRIESSGGSLVPYLALSERLACAGDHAGACEAFADCVRQVVAAAQRARVEETPPGGEPGEGDAIRVIQSAPGQPRSLHIPLDTGPAAPLRAVVDLPGREPVAADIDCCALAANLLAARLRQLYLVAQLESARARLAAKNRYLREKASGRASGGLVGDGPAMQALRDQIAKVAMSDATVLITGPSGSGKELVAREIHRLSLRHTELLAAVNCGALVESLLETELFGCRKGAFTGAVRDREGLFEVAHGGTLFLDEIGDMAPALQVKLLRVLESGEVTPVGDTRPRRIDVRVLAATHRELEREVAAGRFREDLYYRIHVVPVRVPSLDERREDIPALARHFLHRFAEEIGSPVSDLDEEALRLLAARSYPGNIRQLANTIQRAVLLAGDATRIQPAHLAAEDDAGAARAIQDAGQGTLREQMDKVERVLIEEALASCGQNRTHAARRLGITRQALLAKLNKHGITKKK